MKSLLILSANLMYVNQQILECRRIGVMRHEFRDLVRTVPPIGTSVTNQRRCRSRI